MLWPSVHKSYRTQRQFWEPEEQKNLYCLSADQTKTKHQRQTVSFLSSQAKFPKQYIKLPMTLLCACLVLAAEMSISHWSRDSLWCPPALHLSRLHMEIVSYQMWTAAGSLLCYCRPRAVVVVGGYLGQIRVCCPARVSQLFWPELSVCSLQCVSAVLELNSQTLLHFLRFKTRTDLSSPFYTFTAAINMCVLP